MSGICEPILRKISFLYKIKQKYSIKPLKLGELFGNIFSEKLSASSPTETTVSKVLWGFLLVCRS